MKDFSQQKIQYSTVKDKFTQLQKDYDECVRNLTEAIDLKQQKEEQYNKKVFELEQLTAKFNLSEEEGGAQKKDLDKAKKRLTEL